MIRSSGLRELMPALVLLATPPFVGTVQAADQAPKLDARIMLDAYRLAVEARLEGVRNAARGLATTAEARSGDWAQIQAPLGAMASGVSEAAAVWFALPDRMAPETALSCRDPVAP